MREGECVCLKKCIIFLFVFEARARVCVCVCVCVLLFVVLTFIFLICLTSDMSNVLTASSTSTKEGGMGSRLMDIGGSLHAKVVGKMHPAFKQAKLPHDSLDECTRHHFTPSIDETRHNRCA